MRIVIARALYQTQQVSILGKALALEVKGFNSNKEHTRLSASCGAKVFLTLNHFICDTHSIRICTNNYSVFTLNYLLDCIANFITNI